MHSKGFTLIECVMTLVLLGILAVISVSVISIFKYKSEQCVLMQTDLISASNCIERIKAIADTGEFVKNRNNLVCSNASIVVQALKPIPENSVPDNGMIRIVPAHVEMMGFLGIGNNPMVGCTVACAVDVATALNK